MTAKTDAKPFQQATVKAVMKSFRKSRACRRFLIADEVGLGKTIVAREVIRHMMESLNRPLRVVYVCSNLAIRGQNQASLLKVLPEDERDDARCSVDRLSLITDVDEPIHSKLHLYSLTPDTSVPVRKNRRRDGRKEERALVHALVEKLWPKMLKRDEWGKKVFQQGAKTHWMGAVRRQRGAAESHSLQQAFLTSVRKEFDLQPRQQLLPHLRTLDSNDRELRLIAHMRNALAASTIERIQPDLVIFDEFQRFRDLLNPKLSDAERRVVGRLRGDDTDHPPALLMLSATPYQLFSRRWEEESGTSHRAQFFELIEFLYGNDRLAKKKRKECEIAFQTLESEIRKGETTSERAIAARTNVEKLLRPIMARTERASHADGWAEFKTETVAASVGAQDMRLFRHLSDSFSEKHRSAAVDYWTSIPIPMQTMGRHYLTWRDATPASLGPSSSKAFEFTEAMRDRFRLPADWPHPRMRAMDAMVTADQLKTPWLPPTAAWWPLAGRWAKKETTPRKALVFSRFQAVPQAIASMMSYGVEASVFAKQGITYDKVTQQRWFTAGPKRHATLALFHPSPFSVESTNPLAEPIGSLGDARRLIRKQLKTALVEHEISIVKDGPSKPFWKLLAQLDEKTETLSWTMDAWWRLHHEIASTESEDAGMAQLLKDWEGAGAESLDQISRSQFDELADHALNSPGVIVGRALRRHWPDAVNEEGFGWTLNASWLGLRNYLDQRWFYGSLRKKGEKYPDAVKRAVLDGNLEAVLDEHLWITSQLRNIEGTELATELCEGMAIRSGRFSLHPIEGDRDATFQMRCHAALPFTGQRSSSSDDSSEKPLRTDDLRRAFNTPFWPFVLTTTSVGQEGLDFHAWCDRLVHWDLCRNPADLEQREGRIQRFGGSAIRRAIVDNLPSPPLVDLKLHESPWSKIAELADEHLSDESGLAPWWVCEGGNIERFVFEVPTSEQNHWLHWMKEQRMLYRLALGQPNQEDLLEVLASKTDINPDDLRNAVINLSPWFSNPANVSPDN